MAENNARAILKFNGGEAAKILKLNYRVGRSVDVSGRVASDPSNAMIKITIEATDNTAILESLLNGKYKPSKGTITFNKSHEEGTLINLEWENGYVIDHDLEFDAIGSHSMYVTFVVSAEQIVYGDAAYNGFWPA
ncbi:MAG: hypothetical protein EOP54_00955 [Sphingobacteriales bacterium]|nr:MAG: hypothetical protein EOP54_00955 [Sphingobacteriales bacterium]